MTAFGLVLLVPSWGERFALATGGLAARADAGPDEPSRDGLCAQALGGALLGAAWSLCVGPTLDAAIAIALAATGEGLGQAGAVMASFAAGVATLILLLAYGAREAIHRRQGALRALAARARPVLGAVFVLLGLALWFGLNHAVEAWALRVMPPWLADLSVSL